MKATMKMLLIFSMMFWGGVQPAQADAVIFSGSDVKTLKPNIDLNGNAKILSGSVDPTSSATSAPVGSLYLNTSTGLSYRKLDSGSSTNWSVLGSGSSSGQNYITNGQAEAGTTGWATYADAAGPAPVDCTGGSPTVTYTRSTSSPLAGIGSFLYTKDASNRQGQGASYAFTIDAKDQGKPLQIAMDWSLVSGTWAGSVTPGTNSDVVVAIYDVTNATLIEPAGKLLDPAVTGQFYRYRGTFQAAINSTSYRLCFHSATTSASAFVLKNDQISVGPQVVSNGAVVGDLIAFTPTGSWSSNTTYTGFWRRVGDMMHLQYRVALAGAPTSAALTLNLPSGYSIDTAKLPTTTQYSQIILGVSALRDEGVTISTGRVMYNGTSSIAVFAELASGTYGGYSEVTQAVPHTWGNTDSITVTAEVPIVGWSSNVQMSSETDTRVISARATRSSSQSISNSSQTDVVFNAISIDKTGTFNTSTGIYTCTTAGSYRASAHVEFAANATGYRQVFLVKDGSNYSQLGLDPAPSGTVATSVGGSDIVECSAGSTLKIGVVQTSGGSLNIGPTGSVYTFFSIERISGPAQIAASETVSLVARKSSDQTGLNNTDVQVTFQTIVDDSHGAFASNVFTAPISGRYYVACSVNFGDLTGAVYARVRVRKNSVAQVGVYHYATSSDQVEINSMTLKLVAGDTVDCTGGSNDASFSLVTGESGTSITVYRIGN